MTVWSLTKEDLENQADTTKVAVMEALVKEGFITPEFAEGWAKTHTIIYRKKSIFRTISDLWRNTNETTKAFNILVVKNVMDETLPPPEVRNLPI